MFDHQTQPVPTEVAVTSLVVQKTQALTRSAAEMNPLALLKLSEIRRFGLPIFISGAVDLTGSMYEDINMVNNGVAKYLTKCTQTLPEQVVSSLGPNFLRVSGASIKFRDIECDGADSFGMSLFNQTLPATFVEKSTKFTSNDTNGGGGNKGESQLLALLMTMGIPRSNPLVGSVFEQITSQLSTDKVNSVPAKWQRFVQLYDEYAAFERKPDMVYMVTDEPPKVQLGVSAQTIAKLREVMKLPKMVFFIRHYMSEWSSVAKELGAQVYDLANAGDVDVNQQSAVADFMGKAFGSALMLSLNESLPQLTAGA